MTTETGAAVALPGGPSTDHRRGRGRAIVATALLIAAAGAGVLFGDPLTTGSLLAIVGLLYLFRAAVFSWPGAAVGLVLVICLVPARRYTLPVTLPFAAEPYRIVVIAMLAVVIAALLIDPAFRWQKLELGGPVAIFLATQLLSIAVNLPGLIDHGLVSNAGMSLVSLLIITAVFVLSRQLFRSRRMVQLVLHALGLCGALVGALATVERVTRNNLFLDFFSLLPLHRLSESESLFVKAGTVRAFGPAQHPIALAVFLTMLIPITVYLAKHADWPRRPAPRELFWLGCTVLIALGMLAAVSRTSLVSIAVMLIVVVLLRPGILPKLLVYGVLGIGAAFLVSARNMIALVSQFTDPQALIASQEQSPGWTGSGRLADLGPSLAAAASHPLVGTGLGSRVTIGPSANALILDDQYLTSLLESGAIGVLGIAIMMLVPFGRLAAFGARSARPGEPGDAQERRDLAVAVAVSIIGYAVALFFFDGFSFIQTLLTFLLVLALGSWALVGERATTLVFAEVPLAARRRRNGHPVGAGDPGRSEAAAP
jgi:O-antigen ligase